MLPSNGDKQTAGNCCREGNTWSIFAEQIYNPCNWYRVDYGASLNSGQGFPVRLQSPKSPRRRLGLHSLARQYRTNRWGVEVDHSEENVFEQHYRSVDIIVGDFTFQEKLSGAGLCLKISINNDRLFGLWYL